jgi:membrane-associated phospholipid phosphatase
MNIDDTEPGAEAGRAAGETGVATVAGATDIAAHGAARASGAEPLAVERGVAGRLPMNRLFAGYMAVSALAAFFPQRGRGWQLLLLAHLGAGALALGNRPFRPAVLAARRRWPAVQGFLADWYPLLLIPLLYGELEPLNRAIYGGRYFDETIIRWEELLFGGQPSQALAAAFPSLLLSEVLHAAYLSYYLVIFGPPLYLYLTGRREEFRQAAFALMLVFFLHYLFFIYLPVQGPRYLFPAPGGVLATGSFYQLAHRILEAGSSQGAAFPSSHVGVAFAQAALAVRYLPRSASTLFITATALALGAIYGGFHYATDAVAGLALGLAGVAIAGPLGRLLGHRETRVLRPDH